ncbi:L-fucose:H+ symporter permease [Granulicella sp. S156]|uniref:L-fucose:H+ symporter permease n=1 Tax=Granulicella sp. S156 TaxID=1747224 RepID=UPI00131C3378|nr:L-fucose:H+ symporter permease [Granulicella sp. S156]
MNIAVDTPTTVERPSNGKQPGLFPAGHMLPFMLVTVLFFIWGMSNNLTDILVQQFKKSFELSPLQAQLVQTAVFFGYFCMALPAALGMRRWGYKAGILAGLCLFGTGTLMFWPAAVIGRYWLMLTALFVVGCGSATLETAANPFIAQTGAPETSEQRLNFSQAFNPPGTITGVLIGTFFIFSGVELSAARVMQMKTAGTYAAYLHGEIMRVVPTYVTLGCIVFLLALLIGLTKFPANVRERDASEEHGLLSQLASLLRTPGLRAAIIAQFCYCGAQVSTWSAFIPYVKQYTSASERTAALFLTGNLIAFAAGRIISTGLMRWFAPSKMMGVYALINIGLIAAGILHPGRIGAGALLLTSFFMSVMFPTIFALGVKGLGARTKLGGSMIVMSVVGAGIVPPLLGLIAKHFGSYALGYVVVIACYVVVAAYGLRAHPTHSVHTVPVMP